MHYVTLFYYIYSIGYELDQKLQAGSRESTHESTQKSLACSNTFRQLHFGAAKCGVS